MSIEITRQASIQLEGISSTEELLEMVQTHEDANRRVVYLTGTISNWDNIKTALCALRASNMNGLLLLEEDHHPVALSTLPNYIEFLRSWDQLFIHNLIHLAGGFIPMEYRDALQAEVKTELKWFQEWFAADSDPRIYNYPSMPWRNYIRKINSENYQFARNLLAMVMQGNMEDRREMDELFKRFLAAKKQVLCVFPKKWNRFQ